MRAHWTELIAVSIVLALAIGCDEGASSDAGTDGGERDAGADAGSDPGVDAGLDAGHDASTPPDECGPTAGPETFTPGSGEWRTDFVLPGARAVYDLARGPDGSLYVGGDFAHVSGTPARNVARLAPAGAWEALGSGLVGAVSALAVSPAGTVYAATGPDPTTWSLYEPAERDAAIARVYRYDGAEWQLVGTIDGGAVFGLAVDGDERLYAIGDFTAVDGVPASRFAVLEGGTWSEARALGQPAVAVHADADGACFAGFTGATDDTLVVECGEPGAFTSLPLPSGFSRRILPAGFGLFAIAPPIVTMTRDAEGRLVIGGNFEWSAFEPGFGSLARWEGDRWEPVGGGVGYDPSSDFLEEWGVVADLAVDADGSLVVAGDFPRAGEASSPPVHGLARWTGTAWEDVPSAELGSGGLGDGILVGVGRFEKVEHAPGGLAVVGPFARIEGVASRRIAFWTGAAWAPAPSSGPLFGLDGEVRAIALRGSCGPYVGGAFASDGSGRELRYVARWDGERWQPVGSGAPEEVWALAIAPNGELYSVTQSAGEWFAGDAVVRRGESFEEIGATTGVDGWPGEIRALAVGADGRVYVAGRFASIGGVDANNVALYDGTAWLPLGAGVDGWIEDLAVAPDGRVVVVGNLEGGSHVVAFDGASWAPLGELSSLPLSGVAIWKGDVVVVANLDGGSDASGPFVARFDGSEWHDLGSSSFRRVAGGRTRIVAAGAALVLAGQLPLFDDPARTAKLAVWNGDAGAWVPLDRSTGDFGHAAAVSSEGAWLGGSFMVAGDVPADQIAFFRFDAPD